MTPYKLTDETIQYYGRTLYRIELTEDCKWGSKGTKGGFIESTDNLTEDAWVSGNAYVSGYANVSGDAWVSDNAWVYGNANVYGNAYVSGNAWVSGNAHIETTSDYMTISSLGSLCRTITITFSDKMIVAGCFRGTLEEFKTAVDKKYNGQGNYYPTINFITELFK
jgi:carbonic anhydrase/acetyltransferase-like protein (isoleucine patch superfamily)